MKVRTAPEKIVDVFPSSARSVWWLHPSVIVFFILIPGYLLLWAVGVQTRGEVSTAKGFFFLKGDVALLGLTGLLVLAFGTLSPIRPSNRHSVSGTTFVSPKVLTLLGLLTMLGYAYWFKDFLLRPGTLLAVIKNSTSVTYAIRGSLEKSAGIASLAQLGLPFLVLYAHAHWAGGRALLTSRHHYLFAAVLLAVAFRAFAWGERVALVEAAIAVGFVWVAFAEIRSSIAKRLLPWIPLAGIVLIVGLFALGEYFRSWSAHYSGTHTSFWDFILQRLTNYYFTALNTGAGRLAMYEWPTYTFEWTLRWVHKLPLVGPVFSYLVDARHDFFLYRYGDPEFNNPSGLFSIFYDLGLIGGFTVLLFIGSVGKYVFLMWRGASGIGGTFYFLFLMTFMELFRYFYLGDSRCFMVVLGLMLAAAFHVKVKRDDTVSS